MQLAEVSHPNTWELVSFIVQVVLISGVGGYLKYRSDLQKQRENILQKQLDRLAAELKPVLDSQASLAAEISTRYYMPVLNAFRSVEVYVDTYEVMTQTLADGRTQPEVKQALREALPNCANYLFAELKAFYEAVGNLIRSGYIWELEEDIGLENIKHIFNWYNAAEIQGLLKRNSTDALTDFLKSWKTAELEPLRKLKKQVPWQKFLSSYYRKLRDAVRV
jgi:hypothetical protein